MQNYLPWNDQIVLGAEVKREANYFAENRIGLRYNTCCASCTLLCLVYSNKGENCAGEIFFWLVIRHKGKLGLTYFPTYFFSFVLGLYQL